MDLDIRAAIGALLLAIGLILAVYGLGAGGDANARSLGMNINLIWGSLLAVFGAGLLLLSWLKRRD